MWHKAVEYPRFVLLVCCRARLEVCLSLDLFSGAKISKVVFFFFFFPLNCSDFPVDTPRTHCKVNQKIKVNINMTPLPSEQETLLTFSSLLIM